MVWNHPSCMKNSAKSVKSGTAARGQKEAAEPAVKLPPKPSLKTTKLTSKSGPLAPVSPLKLAAKETVGKRILVIDIGGSNVKVMIADQPRRKIPTRTASTPSQLVSEVLANTQDWKFDAISIGFPAPVENGNILKEPNNLAPGWMKFNWEKAFGKPVRIINDAAMQALGSYEGGRMLFLGLGTGLGSALVHHGALIPLELCAARYSKQLTLEDVLGKRGYKRIGLAKWEKALGEIVELLRSWFLVDYIVLGGGNVKKLAKLPEGTRPGDNQNAFIGGVRMWSPKIEAANQPDAGF